MAISKLVGGTAILLAFIIAGKVQAANVTNTIDLKQYNRIITEHQLLKK